MNNTITHSGIIEQIERGHIIVRISQVSGCAACKIAGHCNASESKEKLIDIYNVDTTKYHVGDSVTVTADMKTGYRAVALGFGVPLIILMISIFGIRALTGNEAQAALIGLAALIPYYVFLYLIRDRLRTKFSFNIE
jgi:positive regulator of sigma E activity